jgi:hypothetical protein
MGKKAHQSGKSGHNSLKRMTHSQAKRNQQSKHKRLSDASEHQRFNNSIVARARVVNDEKYRAFIVQRDAAQAARLAKSNPNVIVYREDVPMQGIFQPSSAGAGDGTVSVSDHVVVGSGIEVP